MRESLTLRIDLSTIIKFALIVLGIYAIESRLWASEDAYITFRYVDNFVRGHGLVYNLGDRVEGFTHPLWLFLISVPSSFGVYPRASALWLSLGLTIGFFLVLVLKDKNSNGQTILFPFALVLFLTHTGFRDFSVSGLEFPLLCFLMALFWISYKQHHLLARPIYHSTLLSLIYLTRPELILLSVFVLAHSAISKIRLIRAKSISFRSEIRSILLFFLPMILLIGGYHLFRWLYYREVFPNTLYAKDGLGSYWSPGWIYFLHFWRHSPILSAVTFFLFIGIVFSPRVRACCFGDSRKVVLWLTGIALFVYVIRLGGDFMAYRFLLPFLLIMGFITNDLIDTVFTEKRLHNIMACILTAITGFFVIYPYEAPFQARYIANERQFYNFYHPPVLALFQEPVQQSWYQDGLTLKRFQAVWNQPITVAAPNIGYYGYAAGQSVTVIDVFGLVDRQTARNWKAVKHRGRPGHESKLPLEMAVDRGVAFYRFDDGNFVKWHKIMNTPFGVLSTLDPRLLLAFPEQLEKLKNFKREVLSGRIRKSNSFDLLIRLEKKYGITLEDIRSGSNLAQIEGLRKAIPSTKSDNPSLDAVLEAPQREFNFSALGMALATDNPDLDCFDIVYRSPLMQDDASIGLEYVEKQRRLIAGWKGYRKDFGLGLVNAALLFLEAKQAFEMRGSKWFQDFDTDEFRNQYGRAKKHFEAAGFQNITKQLEVAEQKIDKDRNNILSNEEIEEFFSTKLQLLESWKD